MLRVTLLASLVVAVTCLLLPALTLAAGAADAPALEYKVKAGYLFNFAKLVEWPTNALPATDSPLIIGVLDAGEALPALQTLLAGKTVNQHPVQVLAVQAEHLGSGLHLLFVTRAAGKSPAELTLALRGAPTLLVGENEGFAQHGGSLNFYKLDNSVKFEANPDAAARARLKLGSQLLKLARVVRDAPAAKKE